VDHQGLNTRTARFYWPGTGYTHGMHAEFTRMRVPVLPHSGWLTVLKLTCRVPGTNPSILARKRAWSRQIGETKYTEIEPGARDGRAFTEILTPIEK